MRNNRVWLKYATANTPDTSYLINSVQKSMTATMVMRAIDHGKLKLNTKLSKYYPTVPGADQITIKNLLDMTSGLAVKRKQILGTAVYISDRDNIDADIEKTSFNPKMLNKWHYTSLNYIYLCGILMKVEHKSYEELFNDTYIKPLKLKHTEFLWSSMPQLLSNNWVPGYNLINGSFQVFSHDHAVFDARNELGAGSIVMSNGDLAKVIRAILSGELLSKTSQKALFTGKAPSYYGGGFYNSNGFKKANGAGEGYTTFLRVSKDGKTMIIVQTNRSNMKLYNYYKKHLDAAMQILQDF